MFYWTFFNFEWKNLLFRLQESQKHLKPGSGNTFLLIKLKNFRNSKDAHLSFSHKNPIFGPFLYFLMTKKWFSVEVVILADFRFRHVFTNKLSLKVGLNIIFYHKNLLRTLRLMHLLWKKKTFISNPNPFLGVPKTSKIGFSHCFPWIFTK